MASLSKKVALRLTSTGYPFALLKPSSYRLSCEHQLDVYMGRTQTSSSTFKLEAARQVASRIEGFGVRVDDILNNPIVMSLPINEIENRLQFCAEGGLKTSVLSVTRFDDIVKSPLKVLKDADILPKNVDIIESMVSCINFDGPPPSHIDMNLSYERIHFLVLCHFMQCTFGNTFPLWKRYYHTSIKFSLQNIVTLQEVNIGWQWIRDHPSLVCFSNPYNLINLHQMFKIFEAPLSLCLLLRRDSDIAFVDCEDLKAIFFILMENKVCIHDYLKEKRSDHFLVNPDFLDKQIKRLKTTKSDSSDSILSMLYQQKYIPRVQKKSIEHIKTMIAKISNPLPLLKEESPFEEGSWQHRMQLWLDKKNLRLVHKPCQHDPYTVSVEEEEEEAKQKRRSSVDKKSMRLPAFIATSLNLSPLHVKSQLSLLPLGLTVNTSRASTTLKFLLESGFSVEDIGKNTQLLLYPRHVVQETLNLVVSDPVYGSAKYQERHLQLCLYLILMRFSYSLYPV